MACKNNKNPVHLTTILCQFQLGLAMDSIVLLRLHFLMRPRTDWRLENFEFIYVFNYNLFH